MTSPPHSYGGLERVYRITKGNGSTAQENAQRKTLKIIITKGNILANSGCVVFE
jgi:hypothetical protein